MKKHLWSLILVSMLSGQAHLARAEPNASAADEPKAPDIAQQCQKAFNMSESMNVDDSVKKLCALNDVPDDKFMEKLGEVVGQTSSKK